MHKKNEKLLQPVVEACLQGDGDDAIERLLGAAARLAEMSSFDGGGRGGAAFEEALETCKGQLTSMALGMGQAEFVAITGQLGLVPPQPMVSQPEWRAQVSDVLRAARERSAASAKAE